MLGWADATGRRVVTTHCYVTPDGDLLPGWRLDPKSLFDPRDGNWYRVAYKEDG